MDTSSSSSPSSSLVSPSSTFLFHSPPLRRKTMPCPRFITFATRRDPHDGRRKSWGKMVDEDMVVLRKRIHEKKMEEMNYEPPPEWMEWEKRYYTRYDSDVCEAVGLLQTLLMNTRPGVALGMLALVAMSVPVATGVSMFHLFRVAQMLLSLVRFG